MSDLFDAVDTFMGGYWPKEVVEDWRYKKLFAAMETVAQEQLVAPEEVDEGQGLVLKPLHAYFGKSESAPPGPLPTAETSGVRFVDALCMEAHKYVHGIMQPCPNCSPKPKLMTAAEASAYTRSLTGDAPDE